MVECYWVVEGNETGIQKISPDGYSEFIFHYGDLYKVITERQEIVQSLIIAAGQLNAPIHLRPTGKSGVLGIKFQPAGIWKMFGCDMHLLTNQTFDLRSVLQRNIDQVATQIQDASTTVDRIKTIERFLLKHLSNLRPTSEIDFILQQIKENNGQVSLKDLSLRTKFSSRKMERLFKQQVGVSPKLYSRLMRFTYAYNLLHQRTLTKAQATYLSGYFDQPHFNKEFREFTGENPEAYFKGDHRFSNFFLTP